MYCTSMLVGGRTRKEILEGEEAHLLRRLAIANSFVIAAFVLQCGQKCSSTDTSAL